MLLLHREIDKLFHCYMHTTVHVQKRKILMKAKFVNEIENVLKNYILYKFESVHWYMLWTRTLLDTRTSGQKEGAGQKNSDEIWR